jgi:hypothetical protein
VVFLGNGGLMPEANQTPTVTTWGLWSETATSTTSVWSVWNSINQTSTGNCQIMGQPGWAVQYAEHERVRAERAAVAKKARRLLRDHLTDAQRQALDMHGWFLVEGGQSRKLYRIYNRHHAGNIYELDEKMKEIARYCVHMPADIPLGDQLLGQALSLRFDEDHIMAKANRTILAAA